MICHTPRHFAVVFCLIFVAPGWSIPAGKDRPLRDPPGAAAQRALDCCITLEVTDAPLAGVLRQLSDLAHVPIVWDRHVHSGNPDEMLVAVKAKETKLRQVLQTVTGQHGLTFGVVGDHIVVGTEEVVNLRQLRQRVDLTLLEEPMTVALHELAKQTGANVVLDPRARKSAEECRLTLTLKDVPLETAVRLLAELSGLCALRMGNVMFVTTEDRAEKIKSEMGSAMTSNKEAATPATPNGPQPMVLPAGPPPVRAVPPPAAPRAVLPPFGMRWFPFRAPVQRMVNCVELAALLVSQRLALMP